MTADKSQNEPVRIESDSMGRMQVPDWALWGASTQRAVENFPISRRPVPAALVHALGLLKAACAVVNRDLGKLEGETAGAIIEAANDVAAGRYDRHFPVDLYQTGSGTSTNMNANEVIATLANRLSGRVAGSSEVIHPNDHVNMGQSSNDTFPTAMHIASVRALTELKSSLGRVERTLRDRGEQWDGIIKVGRTHLMDATPIRMGQIFSGYAEQLRRSVGRVESSIDELRTNMPIGGTAVGTGINTHAVFGRRVCEYLTERTGVHFEEASDHCESQGAKDSFVHVSGHLKTVAVSLGKIANDIRLLGSGPRCGLGELVLPAVQPGSSIMPGKVNPVICESVIQVAARVVANDAAVTCGAFGGVGSIFELNVAMPLIADAVLESIQLLDNVSNVMVDKLLIGLEVNRQQCADLIERSLMIVTALAPEIGYDKAAELAKQAFEERRTIREVAVEQGILTGEKLDELLDLTAMTRPG